jgi:NADH dehydrogenase
MQATVLGGTGYLGRRIVETLVARGHGVRIATRHPDQHAVRRALMRAPGSIRLVEADIRDDTAVAAAVDGAAAVVNAVGLYVEEGAATFEAVHVEAAGRVAEAVRDAGVPRLVHISGIGADPRSPSAYVRSRGLGEQVVREAFPAATILRPSAMFGETDGLIGNLRGLISSPVIPLFGRGRTRLQPVFVGDVANAVVETVETSWTAGRILELGGPEVYSYRELVRLVLHAGGYRRLLVPVPFAVWDGLAALGRWLPKPPLTEGQVALLRHDNVVGEDVPGLPALGIEPTALETMLKQHPP